MNRGQRCGKTGILHTHLDRDGRPLGMGKSEQIAKKIACAQTTEIVQNDYQYDDTMVPPVRSFEALCPTIIATNEAIINDEKAGRYATARLVK